MTTIEEQINLEKSMVAAGAERYRTSVSSAEEHERGADTLYAQRLMQSFLEPVADSIQEYINDTTPGRAGKYRKILRSIDPYKIAYIGVRCVLNHFTREESLASLGIKIGTMIEDELKFIKFKKVYGDYYETIIKDFNRKGTKSYRHMHRVLTMKSKEKDVQWTNWSSADKCNIGIKLVDIIMQSTDMIEKSTGENKKKNGKLPPTIIKASIECLEWIRRYGEHAELLNPDRVPCIIVPDDWTAIDQGGYYSPQLRNRTPMVKTRSRKHRELLDKADLRQVMNALNALQHVEWEVNTGVLDVLKDAWNRSLDIGLPQSEPYIIPVCPLKDKDKADFTDKDKEIFEHWKSEARLVYTMERERVSKCFQVIRSLQLANKFKAYKRFYYVYQCDFRGRIYSTVNGLTPQGADYSKALIRFHEGKPLGKFGVPWFKIHGANCFGKDKLPYMDRVKWVDDNKDMLLSIAENPLSTSELWSGADSPWCFLAWVLEYKEFIKQGPAFISRIPIALDGSCNGLQNFSALLRDPIGGSATNLVKHDAPFDIYAEVARVCTNKLRVRINEPEAEKWLALADKHGGLLKRGLAKRPVMTLPYGSTRQSCREYVYKYIIEDEPDFFKKEDRFKLSVYITPILWSSISEVVVAARNAMDWLQECVTQLSQKQLPVQWTAPNGFLVYQDRKKIISRQIHTELAGHFRLRLEEESNTIDAQKQRSGISPNFIHSMDASHLMFTINGCANNGIYNLACIHDSIGTYACDTPMLHKVIREEFIRLYGEHDPLQDFVESNAEAELPEAPVKGKLDLAEITSASYFFG